MVTAADNITGLIGNTPLLKAPRMFMSSWNSLIPVVQSRTGLP